MAAVVGIDGLFCFCIKYNNFCSGRTNIYSCNKFFVANCHSTHSILLFDVCFILFKKLRICNIRVLLCKPTRKSILCAAEGKSG